MKNRRGIAKVFSVQSACGGSVFSRRADRQLTTDNGSAEGGTTDDARRLSTRRLFVAQSDMARTPDFFRDFGILPEDSPPPPETIRAEFSAVRVFGQYLGTFIMSALGIGIGTLMAVTIMFPINLIAAAVALGGFGALVYLATRNDYRWVELHGDTLRARHLYTGRIVERSIEEIDELITILFQVRGAATLITEAWLGRVRGIMIRFRDQRTPLLVCRSDPKMTNAKELMEAILYRMSQKGEIDAEIIDLEGKPLVRRIYWVDSDRAST
jgi:hypothetical protein